MAPSVSHDQRLPVNLSRSFSEPTDRSIDPIGSTICSLSFARSLRFFNRLFSTRLSLALFYPFFFTRSFSRAEALSMEQQEICVRHDRILQLSFVLFCFCAFGYSLSHGNRTQHNGPDRPTGRIFQLLCMRFVYSSFDDLYRVVSSASTPSTSFTLHSGVPPTRIYPLLV